MGREQIVVTDPAVTANALVYVSGDDGDALLEPGESRRYQVSTTTPAARSAATCGPITNIAMLAALTGEGNTANNQSTVVTSVEGCTTPPPVQISGTPAISPTQLGISKVGPRVAEAGSVVRYRITVTNRGQVIANQVVLRDVLPNGFALVGRVNGVTLRKVC